MSRATHTVLVDANVLFREGLRRILADTAFRVSGGADTLEEALKRLPAKAPPELLLLSAGGDYGNTAVEVQSFKSAYPYARVVILSEQCDLDSVITVLRAAVDGVILTSIDARTLAKSLELVMQGQSVLSSSVIDLLVGRLERKTTMAIAIAGPSTPDDDRIDRPAISKKFSGREVEILECLTRGDANKLIARKFDIAEATVKVHVKAILRKIQVQNRTQAAIWAQRYLPVPGKSDLDALDGDSARGDVTGKDEAAPETS
jgi:two-component system nitrate/nitrite response regulator NarL